MSEIIHVDERIIEILSLFATEIKTGRVREGEAIDKTGCILTAYMEGMVKNEKINKSYYSTYCPPPVPMEKGETISEYMERIFPYIGPVTCNSNHEEKPQPQPPVKK